MKALTRFVIFAAFMIPAGVSFVHAQEVSFSDLFTDAQKEQLNEVDELSNKIASLAFEERCTEGIGATREALKRI